MTTYAEQQGRVDQLKRYAKDKECRDCHSHIWIGWNPDANDWALRCKEGFAPDIFDPGHYTNRRLLAMTQLDRRQVDLPQDHAGMLSRIREGVSVGLFPSKQPKPEELAVLATVAVAYGLDPLQQEIIPYQGKPYITIYGRRRLDSASGNKADIRFRLLTEEEEKYFTRLDELKPRDIAMFCVIRDHETGVTVEGFGRVLEKERSERQQGSDHLPTVNRGIEMCQKRAERRAREMLWGPCPRPRGLENIQVLEEGDESNIVEGEVVWREGEPDRATEAPLPDFGECPEHPGEQIHTSYDNWGRMRATHRDGDNWCDYGKICQSQFIETWKAGHDGQMVKREADEWLKTTFGGKTWSKLDVDDMSKAVLLQRGLDPETGELPTDDSEVEDLPDFGPETDPEADEEYQAWLASQAVTQE